MRLRLLLHCKDTDPAELGEKYLLITILPVQGSDDSSRVLVNTSWGSLLYLKCQS